jgi:hypothetical protein
LRGKEVGQPMVPVGQAKAAAAAKKWTKSIAKS